MKTKFLDFWDSIRTSLWFIPALMTVNAVIFAPLIITLDKFFFLEYRELRTFFYAGDPAGARLLLSSMAGSIITVAGVTFSITMVALTLTTSQFGPRLLRNFMADRINKTVLGIFISTFIFCLLVLSSIHNDGANIFVPRIAVSMSIVLVMISFGVLIYFFHHVSTSIHAENVIDSVYHQLEKAIGTIFPAEQDKPPAGEEGNKAEVLDFESGFYVVPAEESGYLRALDEEKLLRIAREKNIVVKVRYRPGNYVFARTPLVLFLPKKELDKETERQVRSAFIVGSSRSPDQDIEFSIHQLVEVALRSLSPGINDPYTAISCIDRLGAALCLMNERVFRTPHRYDDQGKLRLILNVVTYDGILDAAFNQIRQYGRGNVDIHIRLLEILYAVSITTEDRKRLEAVRRHGNMVYRASREAVPEKDDRGDVDVRFQALKERLNSA